MYWTIALSFGFIGTVIAWKILTHLWNKYDPITARVLPSMILTSNMPGHYNYLDLKFSLVRHAVAFLITSIVIFCVGSRVVLNIFFYGQVFYTCSAVVRYMNRKDTLKKLLLSDETEILAQTLTKPFKDSRVVLIYSILATVVTLILYAIRP